MDSIIYTIKQLEQNRSIFLELFSGLSKEEYNYRINDEKWTLLEVLCHLVDEEVEDFRARVKSVLDDPEKPLVPINPAAWIKEKNYQSRDYQKMLTLFMEERKQSTLWLRSLDQPHWSNKFNHSILGPISAEQFLTNWLAHDYLHIRQIMSIKYSFLQQVSGQDLTYAGNW